jgi:hypothetical protein
MLHLSPEQAFHPAQLLFLHFAASHGLTTSDCSAETARSSLHIPGLALCCIWSCAVGHLLRTIMRRRSMPSSDGVMSQTPTLKTIRPVYIACHLIIAIRQHPAGARSIIPIVDTEHWVRAPPP